MKKKLWLLLLLVLPISVFAESDLPEHELVDRYYLENKVTIHSQTYYLYAESYTYENGVYTLVNPVRTYASRIRYDAAPDEIPIVYTCKSETETSCEMVYGVYCKVSTITDEVFPIFGLVDGQTFEERFYAKLSRSYHKEGDHYVLDNPYDYPIFDFSSRDEELKGKYLCSDLTEQCTDILYIVEGDKHGIVVYNINDDIVVGNGFDYEDGQFVLKDIIPTQWPRYEEYVGGYTCFSNETTCDTLYQLTNYTKEEYAYGQGYFEWIDPNYFDGIKVDVDTKIITIEKGNNYDAASYLSNSSSIWVENNEIIKIENDRIVPLKVGKTTVLIQKDGEVVLLRIEITEKDLINPNTGQSIIAMIMIGLLLLVMGVLYQNSKQNNE